MAMDEKKKNHPIYKKLRKSKGVRLWSFSECSSYNNCPHEHYLNKKLKLKGKPNIYTESGSLSHGILEDHYTEERLTREEMTKRFNEGMLKIFTDGYRFPKQSTEIGYMQNMRLYYQSFETDENIKKCEEFVSMPLWIYDKSLVDNYFQGWADAILEKDGEISIGDFKSSTRYYGQELIKKSKQLILYAIAYEYLYKKPVKSVFFDFLKYCNVTYQNDKGRKLSKIIERKDLFTVQNIISVEKAYVFVELNDEIKQEAIDWFISTIHKINNDTTFEKGKDCGINSNYCKNLCGFKDQCIHCGGWHQNQQKIS